MILPAKAASRTKISAKNAVTSPLLDSGALTGNLLKNCIDKTGKLGFEDNYQSNQHHKNQNHFNYPDSLFVLQSRVFGE